MNKLQKTFYLMLTVLLYTDKSFAAFDDYVVSALDEVNIQLEKVATLQDDYSAVAQEYTQGKLGELGDLQAATKQAKKVQQAQKNLDKMKNMKNKLQKIQENLEKVKDDAFAKIQELQELKDNTLGAINEAKDAYSQQIKAAQDLAKQSYEKANAQFEAVSKQVQEVQNKIDEQRKIQGETDDDFIDGVSEETSYEPTSNRAAFNFNQTAEITPLPMAMETMQYNLPQGIGEDGTFVPEITSSHSMTKLPEISAQQTAGNLIENAALTAALPDQEMLQQLPDASQLLEAPNMDALSQPIEKEIAEKAKEELAVNAKTKLSLEEQLLAADENQMSTKSPEEFKAYLAAKDAEKKASQPQRDIQAEKEQFQQKLQAKDEAKRASLGLKSSRRSFRAAKATIESEGGENE